MFHVILIIRWVIINIIVLCGGDSSEREVSLSSSQKINDALLANNFNSKLIDLQNIEDIVDECKKCDIVFIGLHGGIGENGKIQAFFDTLNIKYTGTGSLGSMLAMDKNISKKLASHEGIQTSKWELITKGDQVTISLPFVVKPNSSGSSVGISIVKEEKEIKKAVDLAFKEDNKVIIEEYIDGREFSVGILDEKALPVIEMIPKSGWFDYDNKYIPGRTEEICPANLDETETKTIQEMAEKVHKLLNLSIYSRMDIMRKGYNDFYFLEANTLPGMTATSLLPQEAAAIGIDYNELCKKIIELSLKKN